MRPDFKKKKEKLKPITKDLTEIHFVADLELMTMLNELRSLLGNRNVSGHAELVREVCKIALVKVKKEKGITDANADTKSETAIPKKAASTKTGLRKPSPTPTTSPGEVKSHKRYIPKSVREKAWARDEGRCQFEIQSPARFAEANMRSSWTIAFHSRWVGNPPRKICAVFAAIIISCLPSSHFHLSTWHSLFRALRYKFAEGDIF